MPVNRRGISNGSFFYIGIYDFFNKRDKFLEKMLIVGYNDIQRYKFKCKHGGKRNAPNRNIKFRTDKRVRHGYKSIYRPDRTAGKRKKHNRKSDIFFQDDKR